MAIEFLPIGTVVQLSGSTALVMIAGYLPASQSRPDYVWDYSGFKFPLGYTDDEDIYFFDHTQIETIYAHGYKDIEQEMFVSRLASIRDQVAESFKNSGSMEDESGSGGQQ